VNLTRAELCVIAGGAAITVLIAYLGMRKVDTNGQTQPRYEGEAVMAGLSGAMSVFDHLNEGDHYFHPGYCVDNQTQVFIPHRYPTISGGNITALIHNGFDAMRRQAPQDADWMNSPPGSEVV
jgi:hypothetical protein